MKNNFPQISVIMACYNSSAYITEAINSVLSQTFDELELILIDDSSSDNTLKIAKSFQVKDNRISIISLPVNFGPADARNAGIRIARGEWIGILDSDDISVPLRFEEQIKLAVSDKDLILIGSNAVTIDDKGCELKEHKYPTNHQSLVKRLSTCRAFPPHSSILYKKDVVEKLSAFNSRYVRSQDTDLCFRLSEIGKIASVNMPLIKLRKHKQNLSNSDGGRMQSLFGHAASVCHFIRIYGQSISDPSATKGEIKWIAFLTWLEKELIGECVLEKRQVRADARGQYFAAGNRLSGLLHLGTRLVKSGHASAIVWEKLFGSSLPERLAREWMRMKLTRQ